LRDALISAVESICFKGATSRARHFGLSTRMISRIQKAGGGEGWSEGELEISYAWHEFDNAFVLPLERLMLEVPALILAAGRLPEAFHREEIVKVLAECPLDEMLHGIPDEERQELLYDMKLL